MVDPLTARSISRRVYEQLERNALAARVLATFDHACDLLTIDGDLIALVLNSVGDGPHNIVVEGEPGLFSKLGTGTPALLDAQRVVARPLTVFLDQALVWEPRPDWQVLRADSETILSRLSLVRALAEGLAPPGSLLALLARPAARKPTCPPGLRQGREFPQAVFLTAGDAAHSLSAGWRLALEDRSKLRDGAIRLAGLGGGLTPAGDDMLAGVMLWAWLAHPAPEPFCQVLFEAAAPQTTTLSRAFLEAAAGGEFGSAWHRLLLAMAHGSEGPLVSAVRDVLALGNTSGADTLAGFLWMGEQTR